MYSIRSWSPASFWSCSSSLLLRLLTAQLDVRTRPGLVGGDGGALVLDGVMHHAVDIGQPILPVVLVLLQRDRDVLDELAGLERPGAHGVLPFLVIDVRFAPVLGDDLAEVQGKRRDEVGRVRDFQRHLDGVCIDRAGGSLLVIRADCRQRHHARRLGVRVHHAVQAVDHILGGDWLAVVPLGLRIEVEGIGLAVLAELPACRQVASYVRRDPRSRG